MKKKGSSKPAKGNAIPDKKPINSYKKAAKLGEKERKAIRKGT